MRISTLCIGFPALKICAHIIQRAFAVKHPQLELFQLPALFGDGLFAHSANHFTAAGKDETPFEEHHALLERMDMRFCVQRKAKPREPLRNLPQAFFQKCLVAVNEDEIVHVADVILYANAFFHPMVEIIQQGQLYKL